MKSLVEPGHFGLNKESIIVIKNFVEPEHLKTIQNFLPTINEWVDPGESQYSEDGTCLYNADYWRNRQCSGDIIQKLNNNIYEIIEYYINKMQINRVSATIDNGGGHNLLIDSSKNIS